MANHAVAAEGQDQEALGIGLTVGWQRPQERQGQRAAASCRQEPASCQCQLHGQAPPGCTLLRWEKACEPVTATSSARMLNCPPAENASQADFSEHASAAASSRPSAKREACTAKHCCTYSVDASSCCSSYGPLNDPVTGDTGPALICPCTLTALP